jgi:hypothetical protein
MMVQTYHFYIDDTGTKEISDRARPLFAYVGLITSNTNENYVINELNKLKMKYFGTTDVELKSTWLRISKHRQKEYLDKYKISEEALTNFTDALYERIVQLPVHCLGSIVDKGGLKDTYKKTVYDPSPVCYELLLQRVANYATQYGIGKVNIFIDDMCGKNIRGTEWKELLLNQHRQLKLGNSPLYRTWKKRERMDYSSICDEMCFIDSKDSFFIQIADICAYNVFRQGRDYWKNFDNPPFYEYYERIIPIMHCDPKSGTILNFGVVNFP